MTINKMYTVKEVAEMLRVAEITVIRWIKLGKLPAEKIPGTRRWLINELDIPAYRRNE